MSSESFSFRAVELIELHDTGVCIYPKDTSENEAGWREFREYEGPAFSIMGEDICRLAQMFGIDPLSVEAKSITGEIQRIDPECLEFRIMKSRQEIGRKTDSRYYGGMDLIKNLWAKIDGPKMLQIKVEYAYLDDNDEEANYFKELTYSGSYSVWWKV